MDNLIAIREYMPEMIRQAEAISTVRLAIRNNVSVETDFKITG
jgi:hypothetical protein